MTKTYLIAAFSTIFLFSIASGHTMEELKKEYGEVPQSLVQITAMYESASKSRLTIMN